MKVHLFSDASWNPMSKKATWGAVIRYDDGESKRKGHLKEHSSSGSAEYAALFLALQSLARLVPGGLSHISELTIHLDSDLILNQLSGEWKVASPDIKREFEKCKNFIDGLGAKKIRVSFRRTLRNPAHKLAVSL